MPMGCALSCHIFERFSCAIHWIAENVSGCRFLIHYSDDYFFVIESVQATQKILNIFQKMCSHLGVLLVTVKMAGPSTVMSFLGIELDSMLMQARLRADKLLKYRTNIE